MNVKLGQQMSGLATVASAIDAPGVGTLTFYSTDGGGGNVYDATTVCPATIESTLYVVYV